MRHVRCISMQPAKAQTGICEAVDTDFQARLCFAMEFFTSFLLPIVTLKTGDSTV